MAMQFLYSIMGIKKVSCTQPNIRGRMPMARSASGIAGMLKMVDPDAQSAIIAFNKTTSEEQHRKYIESLSLGTGAILIDRPA